MCEQVAVRSWNRASVAAGAGQVAGSQSARLALFIINSVAIALLSQCRQSANPLISLQPPTELVIRTDGMSRRRG